jgi:hypothetical protein
MLLYDSEVISPYSLPRRYRSVVKVWLYLFLNLGTKWGWVVNTAPWPPYPQEKAMVPTVQETGWTRGPLWIGAENFAPTGIEARNAQSVVRYYTNYSIPANLLFSKHLYVNLPYTFQNLVF